MSGCCTCKNGGHAIICPEHSEEAFELLTQIQERQQRCTNGVWTSPAAEAPEQCGEVAGHPGECWP